jgi:hypothetical protein
LNRQYLLTCMCLVFGTLLTASIIMIIYCIGKTSIAPPANLSFETSNIRHGTAMSRCHEDNYEHNNERRHVFGISFSFIDKQAVNT